jgi:hypothetical protein
MTTRPRDCAVRQVGNRMTALRSIVLAISLLLANIAAVYGTGAFDSATWHDAGTIRGNDRRHPGLGSGAETAANGKRAASPLLMLWTAPFPVTDVP